MTAEPRAVLVVLAKAPVPGRVKTRLCPPATAEQAARIASAALLDSLDAVRAVPGTYTVVALTGAVAEASGAEELEAALASCDVVEQRGDALGERIAAAHADAAVLHPGLPTVQIGMDTPQVTPELLDGCLAQLSGPADAVLGPATDGGWWVLGLTDPRAAGALADVPMSRPDTGELTADVLRSAGLRVRIVSELTDVDTAVEAVAVASEVPGGRFACVVAELDAVFREDVRVTASAITWRAFDAALVGGPSRLLFSDGSEVDLEVRRWEAAAAGDDAWLLDRCSGPTVDLGCGPGRLVTALADRGVPVLGVDESGVAALHCRKRSVTMLCQDLFAPLPAEGAWSHVLLADGNIGIGGDPARLVERAARLLTPGGTLLVEADTRADLIWQGDVRVFSDGVVGDPLPWAVIGVEMLCRLAAAFGLVTTARHVGDRAFLELTGP